MHGGVISFPSLLSLQLLGPPSEWRSPEPGASDFRRSRLVNFCSGSATMLAAARKRAGLATGQLPVRPDARAGQILPTAE
jgi:hypothetical protein